MVFPSSPSERFALTCLALCRAVAASLAFGLMRPPMIVLVWSRVRRAEVAFLDLVSRIAAGRYRAGAVRPVVKPSDCVARAGLGARGGLPRRFGWLMGMMPSEAANFGSQLRAILAEPEMAAVVRDIVQARRILGPVCRMLGVEIPPVKPAVAVDPSAIVKVAVVRVRRVRAPIDFGRIPLPRGVLAAARRQGYGRRLVED